MAWVVVLLLLSWFTAIDPKATSIVGSTDLALYSYVPTIFWMWVFYSFGIRGYFSCSSVNCCLAPYMGRSHLCGQLCGQCAGFC